MYRLSDFPIQITVDFRIAMVDHLYLNRSNILFMIDYSLRGATLLISHIVTSYC